MATAMPPAARAETRPAGEAADRLCLAQWLSPAFPTGAFAYSHGLEQAIASGALRDAAAVTVWLGDVLVYGSGWADAVLLANALRPGADADAFADLARALAMSAERLRETEEQGAAFAATAAALTGRPLPPRPLPVAVGEAARGLGLPAAEIVALYLHAFAANLVSAAVRFLPLGQTEGQKVLADLHPAILRLAARAAEARPDDIEGAALRADLLAMLHETQPVRIFRT